jgi:hypothetical protein
VVKDEKLIVDEEKTKLLREQEKVDRKKRGVKFPEFEKKWLKKKPDPEVLEYYGNWPTMEYKSFTYYGSWRRKSE